MAASVLPGRDRIARIRLAGFRTAAEVCIELSPLTVLIGDNGVGKSTLIEALEILRKMGEETDFLRTLIERHGGPSSLIRTGSAELTLSVDLRGASELTYTVTLARRSEGWLSIVSEQLLEDGGLVFVREVDDDRALVRQDPGQLQLRSPDKSSRAITRMRLALRGIEVQTGFRVEPAWARTNPDERSARSANTIQAADHLDRGGGNLANAYHAMRNRPDWSATLDTLRLLLGQDVDDVICPASPSGGQIGLEVRYRTASVPAAALSDGTLALLSLVAVWRLGDGVRPRTLLAFDEPDLHLHPGVLPYVMGLFEACAEHHPVVIATHSDRLLDCLDAPAASAVLCELDPERRLRLRRPDPDQLARWLARYRGLGGLRADGFEAMVFEEPSADAAVGATVATAPP